MNNENNNVTPRPNAQPSTFNLQQPLDDYIQLSPVGLFPHSRGLQNVDHAALENLVRNFKSFFARVGRRFAGLPFYVGHPDINGFENTYTDRKAYGWIMDLQARPDGLYGRTKWSDAGRELIGSGHYKFLSPTWTAEKIGLQNDRPVYRPTHLISVGLTNQPNLPVPPLANSDHTSDPNSNTETLLGTSVPIPASSPDSAPEQHSDVSPSPLPNTSIVSAPDFSPHLARIDALQESLQNCQRQIADLHSRLITNVLDNAIAAARILPVERKLWQNQLLQDFDTASAALANARPQLNLVPQTDQLTLRNPPPDLSDLNQRRKHLHSRVYEKMRKEGITYHQAWTTLKEDEPGLFYQPEHP